MKFKGDPSQDFTIIENLDDRAGKTVFRAKLKQTEIEVAVKRIDVDAEDAQLAVQEVALLEELHSPHIVQYYGTYTHGHHIYIVMELSSWGSVQDMIDASGALDADSIRAALCGIAGALLALHTRGICHRNVKPGCMLIGVGGDVKLGGFGLSVQHTQLQKMGTFCGTPRYLAPELINGLEYTNAVDVWALGAAAVTMALGKPMYDDMPPVRALFVISQLRAPPPCVRQVRAINADLGEVIRVCLQVDADMRSTPEELLQLPFLQGRSSAVSLNKLDEVDDRKDAAAAAAAASATTPAPPPPSAKPAPLVRTQSSLEREKLLSWLKSAAVQKGAARGALAALQATGADPDDWIKENIRMVRQLADAELKQQKERRDDLRLRRQELRSGRPAAPPGRPQAPPGAPPPIPPSLTLRGVTQMRSMRIDATASVVNFNMSAQGAAKPPKVGNTQLSPRLRQRKLLSRTSARMQIALPTTTAPPALPPSPRAAPPPVAAPSRPAEAPEARDRIVKERPKRRSINDAPIINHVEEDIEKERKEKQKAAKAKEAKAAKEAEKEAAKEAARARAKEEAAAAAAARAKEESRAARDAQRRRDSGPKAPSAPSAPSGPRNVADHVVLAPDLDERLVLTRGEQLLADAIARLRADPGAFATLIEQRRVPHYDDATGGLVLGNCCWQTCEGRKAAIEAVRFLRSLGALPPAQVKSGMVKAARRALKLNPSQPQSLPLLPGYGGAAGSLEQMLCYGMTDADDILMMLLICDGNPARTSRAALCAKSISAFGMAMRPHDELDQQTLIIVAETFADGLFDPP